MGISHRGLHNKTYQVHLKQKLKPAATQAAEGVMKNCASAVKELYKELDFRNPGNIAVRFDGTWMTRGHQSKLFQALPELMVLTSNTRPSSTNLLILFLLTTLVLLICNTTPLGVIFDSQMKLLLKK